MTEAAMVVANFGIFLGYCFIAGVVVPAMPITLLATKVGGFFFFVTCGFTHLELAAHTLFTPGETDLTSWHMVVNHSVQVVAVWLFIWGLFQEFVRPAITLRKAKMKR